MWVKRGERDRTHVVLTIRTVAPPLDQTPQG
jgi:hypothetical protein